MVIKGGLATPHKPNIGGSVLFEWETRPAEFQGAWYGISVWISLFLQGSLYSHKQGLARPPVSVKLLIYSLFHSTTHEFSRSVNT